EKEAVLCEKLQGLNPRWLDVEDRRLGAPAGAAAIDKGADQLPRQGEFPRNIRQVVVVEPARFGNFNVVDANVPAGVVGKEADHQLAGEGPGLTGVVVELPHPQAYLLHHLPAQGLLGGLPRLDKAGKCTEKGPGPLLV